MRKVLLIAYHYPPEPAAGARRPGFLARYLPEFGWDATVLTRPLPLRSGKRDDVEQPGIIAAPLPGASLGKRVRSAIVADNGSAPSPQPSTMRWFLRRARETLMFPDNAAPWLPGAIAAGVRACDAIGFDAVISTAMPATVHLAGAAISRLRKLPWIADYRDLWYGNPYCRHGRLRVRVERDLERRVLRRARRVTTISEALARRLEVLLERPAAVIPNGFDPREWADVEGSTPDTFELCYTGSLYDGSRTPKLLFEALAALKREGDAAAGARIDFFGPNSDHVDELAERFGVTSQVQRHGVVARDLALAAQRAASHLLIFASEDPSTFDELGSKVYEYAGARRPMLVFGPRESALRPYVMRHELGWYASDVDEAKAALREAYGRFAAGDRELHVAPGTVLDARDLARSFAAELDALF